MQKFIFVPVVNHFELLEKAVKSIKHNLFDRYIIFNNSEKEIDNSFYARTPFKIWNPERRMTFTETQNIMRQYAIDNKYDYYCFMHNDGEVVGDADVHLVQYTDSLTGNWGAVFTHYDVLCSYNTHAVEAIGPWGDEEWPYQQTGYYLDNDYYRRLKNSGYEIKHLFGESNISDSLELNKVLHNESSNTIRDSEEQRKWDQQQGAVHQHYIKKWGALPPGEIYHQPFDKK